MIQMSSMSSFTLQGSDWHYRCRPAPQPVLPAWRIPVWYARTVYACVASFASSSTRTIETFKIILTIWSNAGQGRKSLPVSSQFES